MKLKVLQENLATALANASRFTNSRAQLPVLGNILLSAKKTKLLVASTNLEVAVSISIGASVEKEGDITIPARIITELVANLPKETISLSAEKEQLKIEASSFQSNISGMNSSDFPAIPQNIDAKNSIFLPTKSFTGALSQVVFASSVDETRPILTGILFIFKEGVLTLVATDGFRLSQKKIQIEKKGKTEQMVLPKSVLMELARISAEGESILLHSKKEENQVVFGLDSTILSSRVLEGEFPDFEKIIPKEAVVKVMVDKEEMIRAVKLAAIFARESANIVKFKVAKNSLEILAESPSSGNQSTKIDARTEGELAGGLEIAFNYRFLEEFLHCAVGEEIKMEFSSSNSPGVFTDPQDRDFLHLIMPVRIQS